MRNWKKFIIPLILIILLFLFFTFKTAILTFLAGFIIPQTGFDDGSSDSGGSSDTTTYSCVDSDEGLSYYMPGFTTDQDGTKSYDNCEDTVLLTEYYCSDDRVAIREVACPLGYECYETRSGDYCDPIPEVDCGPFEEILTKGYTDGADELLRTPIDIVEFRQGTTYYFENSDFIIDTNLIDWSPNGIEPATGTGYSIIYYSC